jgi:hypothetical protein
MDKRGLSAVISVLILVALVVGMVSFVWVIVNNLVSEEIEGVESCFGVFDSVLINDRYTCYDSATNDVQFSIEMKDIEIEKLLISIVDSSTKSSLSFEITNELKVVADLSAYPSGNQVVLPGKNSGRTYVATGFSGEPSSIEIVPIINGEVCDVSDTLYDIPNCAILVS